MTAPAFFTIGYEQATQPAVLDALREAGVELLVDVRAVAASRRPGFSKRQLAAGLDERGIGYLHLRGLGTPADGRTAARAGRHAEMRRIFEAELAGDRAQGELGELLALIGSGRWVCLLCYERDPTHCHRSIIAERVCERIPAGVEHLAAVPGPLG
jgi:uncharacterized protein (DUF488 family)